VIATALHRGELVLRDDVPDLGGPPIDLSGDVFMGLVEVPNGLDPGHAAMTEPMAVGLHAVNRAAMAPGEGALVRGCGSGRAAGLCRARRPRGALQDLGAPVTGVPTWHPIEGGP